MKSDMEDIEVENQILIARAGPSGLALAAELSRRGVSTAIIDRQAAGANTSRACVVHATDYGGPGAARCDARLAGRGSESSDLSYP
jgi:glycine/D-amino acid oxidase-like deaminating enzyme